jgi:hypothetical protein
MVARGARWERRDAGMADAMADTRGEITSWGTIRTFLEVGT